MEFAYPSRPQTLVLKGFNPEVKLGRSVALVGREREVDVDRAAAALL